MDKEVKPFSSCGGFMTNVTMDGNTPTLAINDEVYGINDLFVSSYILKAGQDESGLPLYIAFDTGNNPETLLETFSQLDINPKQIQAVFLTHAHGDHTGGLAFYHNASVYISQAEKENTRMAEDDQVDLTPDEISNFTSLQSGEIIKINNTTIETIATPGHTSGSVSYLVNNRYIFAGATLNFDPNQKADHQACTLNEDHDLLKKSNLDLAGIAIEKNIEMVFTTHGGYTDNPRRAFSAWLDILPVINS